MNGLGRSAGGAGPISEKVSRYASAAESRMPYWAFLLFLSTTALALVVAALRGAQFFGALGVAMNEFGADVLPKGDVQAYGPFVRSVIETWGERLSQFPVSIRSASILLVSLLIVVSVYRFSLVRPRGISALTDPRVHEETRRQANMAIGEFGYFNDIVRCDPRLGITAASAMARRLYVPVRFLEEVFGVRENHPEKLYFIMAHEMTHAIGKDNAIYSFGVALYVAILVGVAVFFAVPTFMTVMMVLPTTLLTAAGFAVSFMLAVMAGAAALIVSQGAAWLALSGYAAAREFAADRAGAAICGEAGFPYRRDSSDVRPRGKLWTMSILPGERRHHAVGRFPRAGALLAGVGGLWATCRSILLITMPESAYGPVFAYDAVALAVFVLLWRQFAASAPLSTGSRLPWFNLAAAASLYFIVVSAMLGLFFALTKLAPGSGTWSVIFSWPLLITVVAALLVSRRIRKKRTAVASAPAGRHSAVKTFLRLIGATPGLTIAATFFILLVLSCASAIVDFVATLPSGVSFSQLPVLLLTSILTLATAHVSFNNFRYPRVSQVILEISIFTMMGSSLFYLGVSVYGLSFGSSGQFLLDNPEAVLFNLTHPGAPEIGATLMVAAILGIVQAASWAPRWRLLAEGR